MKLKWTVYPPATGRYRSFERRGWPYASYVEHTEYPLSAGIILSQSEYIPRDVKNGSHKPLHVNVAVWANPRITGEAAFQYQKIGAVATLKEAKELLQNYIDEHPEIWPPALSTKTADEPAQKTGSRPKF